MDAVIKQAVREQLEQSTPGPSNERTSRTSTTVNRLSGLLNRIRGNSSRGSSEKRRKTDREHRVQVRWMHYDSARGDFVIVRQKNGGGNRFIAYTASEQLSVKRCHK